MEDEFQQQLVDGMKGQNARLHVICLDTSSLAAEEASDAGGPTQATGEGG